MEPLIVALDNESNSSESSKDLFKSLGITGIFTKDPESFIKELRSKKPNACLIDLNTMERSLGLSLIKAIRRSIGNDFPIFVTANSCDTKALAHAIEKGANDCFIKPFNPKITASKISRYFRTEKINQSEIDLKQVPGGGSPATVSFSAEIEEVDLLGVTLRSNHLIAKGTKIELDGVFFEDLDPEDRTVKVIRTWLHTDCTTYGIYGEFEQPDGKLKESVRLWLLKMESKTPENI